MLTIGVLLEGFKPAKIEGVVAFSPSTTYLRFRGRPAYPPSFFSPECERVLKGKPNGPTETYHC
jgi:hypothetical protein